MKNTVLIIISIICFISNAQEINNDILIGAHITEQAESIPNSAKRILLNKLGRMVTENGISDNVNNSRFIITPNVSVIAKEITPTAPPKLALSLEVTLYVGDGIGGNLFESESLIAKGVGVNENKAYINALKRLNPKSKIISKLIANSKEEILSYYENNCSDIVNKATGLENQGKTGEALFVITNIPESTKCFKENNSKIKSLYKKSIDDDCERKLNTAKAIWAANQNLDAANECGKLLASIDPNAKKFNQVENFYKTISKRVKNLSDRDWEFQLKELELDKSIIESAKEVGIAFGKNQPQTITYNTSDWFR